MLLNFKHHWNFFISRNLPVWHNTLHLMKSNFGYRHYQLGKMYTQLRTHHNLESDFYYISNGSGSNKRFLDRLTSKLKKKSYIIFLKKEYKKDGQKLLNWSKRINSKVNSLKPFLDYCGYCMILLEITSWASKIITDKIVAELKSNPECDKIINYYSTPKKLAPIQQLEKELQQLHKNKDLETIANRLYKKYHWIPVSFVGEPWDKKYFLDLLKNYIPKSVQHKDKPKSKISTKLKFLLWSLREITYLNEYRKGIFCQVTLNFRPVLNEIAHKSNLRDWKEVCLLTHEELILAANGRDFSRLVDRRKKEFFAVHNINGKHLQIIYGKEVKKFENNFKTQKINISEFGGVIANRGRFVGKVKIILNHNDFNKLKPGDILVAKMTSVDYLPIMKNAAAFITDEGGLACHAAVVSREFNIPCIIGTKIATQVLEDGDIVEVNADNGVVSKISS
jgi:phosphohistidine swiveling domain-containing protein